MLSIIIIHHLPFNHYQMHKFGVLIMAHEDSIRERKERSEAKLRSLQVPICAGVSPTRSRCCVPLRDRIGLALAQVFLDRIVSWLKDENLWDFTSPEEKEFLLTPERYEKLRYRLSWRIEGMVSLLWALDKIANLDWPTETCNVGEIIQFVPALGNETSKFIDTRKYRSTAEILDQIDLYYRLHWAVVEANLHNAEMPAGVHSSVVYER